MKGTPALLFLLLMSIIDQSCGVPGGRCSTVPCSRDCCTNPATGLETCCPANAIRPADCDEVGKCKCLDSYYKDDCRTNYCVWADLGKNCGPHGECQPDTTHTGGGNNTRILDCSCHTGWTDHGGTNPTDGKCCKEDPCLSDSSTCNRLECGDACVCTSTPELFHPPREGEIRFGTERFKYYRHKHACKCDNDFYVGINLTLVDYPGTPTCFKKKCTGEGFLVCQEVNGGEPGYEECKPGYSGATCGNPDYCIIDNYNAICTEVDKNAKCSGPIRERKDLRCTCSYGFSGRNCTNQDFCKTKYAGVTESKYCGSHGRCDPVKSNVTAQICTCDARYIGPQCVKDGCESDSCEHAQNPFCVPNDLVAYEYQCDGSSDVIPLCHEGWEGAKCNKENPCITRKECNSGADACGESCCIVDRRVTNQNPTKPLFSAYGFSCNCTTRYSGNRCQHPEKCVMAREDGLAVGNCSGNGNCIFKYNDPSPAHCVCNTPFYGDHCERTDYCAKALGEGGDPCNFGLNPGNRCDRDKTWAATTGSSPQFKCTCATGFRHRSVSDETCIPDPCYQVTCQNGGTPEERADGTCPCTCLHAWHGVTCQFQDQCVLKSPCNAFPCTPVGNSFKCDCPPNGYTSTCEVNDICKVDQGVCDPPGITGPINTCVFSISNNPGEYSCSCAPGWTRDPSVQKPNCFLQDLCTDPDTACHAPGTSHCASFPPNPQATCTCKEDEYYFGPKCQNQNICSDQLSTPYCVRDRTLTCVPITPTSATCACQGGFHGPRCEWVDQCFAAPCQNGGVCSPARDDYACACPPLYRTPGAKNCQFQNGCVRDQPCKNGFPCTPKPNLDGKDDWTCTCGREHQRRSDCSERDPCVTGNRCRNGGACVRVDDVTISCDCTRIPQFLGQLCEVERAVIRLDAFPTTAEVGKQQLFILIVERRGTSPTFKIDLGDSFNFEISERNLLPLNTETIQEQRGILNNAGIDLMTPLANRGWEFFPFTHMYNARGTFSVTTTVSNGGLLSDQRVNQVVADSQFCIPLVTLQNCGRSRSGRQDPKIPTYERKSRFVIEGSLYYEGCQRSAGIKFKWNLFRLTDVSPYPRIDNEWEISGITAHENDDQKHIIFLPYSLLQGEYWIQLFVYYEHETETVQKTPVGNLDWCYFNLKNSPPIARIEGGNTRTIHFHSTGNEPLILNASSSTDENDPRNPKLTFDWSYRIEGDASSYPCSRISRSSCSSSWIQIDLQNLDQSQSYTFHVDVRSDRTNEMVTSSTASQKVNIVNEGMEIIVRCVENCIKFNPGDTVHFECGCRDCDGIPVTYAYGWDNSYGQVTSIASDTFHVTLEPDNSPGQEPREFSCIGSGDHEGERHEGRSALAFVINRPPQPGSCASILPSGLLEFLQPTTSGNIRINCAGFQDPSPPNLPLIYQVNAIIPNNGDLILPGGILLYHDVGEALSLFYFPMGEDQSTFQPYEIHLHVQVSDAFGLPASTSQMIPIQVLPPYPDAAGCSGGATCLDEMQIEFRSRMDKCFGFKSADGSDLSRLMAAGDNQKALQLILSVLYTQKTYLLRNGSELAEVSRLVTNEERKNVSDRIMGALRQIPLYSHLIVKQVMQGLYLLSYYAEFLTDETLLSCAEELIQTAKYFRNFVLRNEEVIYTQDIALLARAGKFAAENIMVETERRGRALMDKDAKTLKKAQEVQLQHLYQVDRDYFLEVGELTTDTENVRIEQPDTTLDQSEVDTVKKMSSICQRAFISMVHLLEAIASRSVITTANEIHLPGSQTPRVVTTVDIQRVDHINENDFSNSQLTFPPEIIELIKKQNTEVIQLHFRESEIDPFFGDFDVQMATKIISVQIKSDAYSNEGADQWIRITETVEPIKIRIPLRDPSQNVLEDTIRDETGNTASGFLSVNLVPFHEISDLNPNIKMYHLSLIHGSSFYMIVTTRSVPEGNYDTIEYQVALVHDYRPTTEEFCRLNHSHTRRFSSGEVIEFNIDDHALDHSENENYLDFYIGIWPFDESGKHPIGTPLNFSVNFVQLSCLTRDEDEHQWVGRGCEVADFVSGEYLECDCHHLSIFAGSVLIPPNKVDIINDIDLFLTIPDNFIVPLTVGIILVLWCLLHLICFWKDRNDLSHHTGITIMCEIGENFSHSFYLVRIVTGSRISAGTTANVSLQIYGEKGRSKVYVVKDPTLSVLNRGGNDSFLISSSKDLGQLEKIRVWHDNTGPRPGWYLRKIHIRDVKTGQRWYFYADTWLSMTYEKDPNIIREFPAATKAELNSWRRRFNDRLVEEFNNSHLWFSIFFRLPSSNFTRCQRLVCSIAILMSHMLFNIMWSGIPTADYSTMFEVGDFNFNFRQVLLGLQIAIVASPVGIILILLFRRIRMHRIPTLVVWQDRIKRGEQDVRVLNYREEHVFLPDMNGEFKKCVIPATGGGDEGGETRRHFSIPTTDMAATDAWVRQDTRGYGLRPPAFREPDAFVHKVVDQEDTTSTAHALQGEFGSIIPNAPARLPISRRAIAESVRRTDPSAFIYSGDGDFEALFHADILARAELNPPWTGLKRRDLQAIGDTVKAELPKLRPVEVVDKEGRKGDVIYHGISLELCLMLPVYKKKGYLPWWFIYISWTFSVLTILTCAFFTVFYGLSIGPLRSKHWVSEVGFAFLQTIVITQPVRILIVATIFSLIYRKIHASEEDRFQVVVADEQENLAGVKKLNFVQFQPGRSYPPLSGATLLALRLKARRRNELKRGVVALFFHILAMIFLASIISNSSSSKFAVTSHLKNMLLLNEQDAFAKIKTPAEFYDYMNYFARIVNPMQDYNGVPVAPVGDARYESTIMADNEVMILGVPRIRQLRIKPTECAIHPNVKLFYMDPGTTLSAAQEEQKNKINCTKGYQSINEDGGTYNPFWKEVIGSSRSWKSTNDIWTWRSPNSTRSIMMSGKVAKYDAGGYVAELGMQFRKTTSVLNYLRQTKWIDSRTRAVFVEMSVIVPNVNIFADVLLSLELSPAGAYVATGRILPLQITFPPTKGEIWRSWVTVSYIGISLYTIGLIFTLGRGIAYHWLHYRMGFIGNLWLWLDFAIGVTSLLSIGLAIKFNLLRMRIHERLDTSLVNEFINLQRIAFWDYMHMSLFAAVFGLCIIKSWRFLILMMNRFYILALTLRLTARFLLALIFLICILVVAFASWGWLAFGHSLEQFHSIGHSFLELKHQLLLPTFYREITSVHLVVGRVYFLLFDLSLVLVGLNVFVALLSSGFSEAKEIARQKRHRETYWTVIRKSGLWRLIFGYQRPKNSEQKLPIPPLRVKGMEESTAAFMRACVNSQGFQRMGEMAKYCNEILKGTGYSVISKQDKKKRIRDSMNTTLSVSQQRMEEMRHVTIDILRQRLRMDLTMEESREYSKFHLKLLDIKLNKVRKMLGKLDMAIHSFLEYLGREKKNAFQVELRKKSEELKQSALGWRRYLPPEVLLNTSASQQRYEEPVDQSEGPRTSRVPTETPESPIPRLRHQSYF